MSYYAEQVIDSVTQTSGQSLGRILVDSIRKQFPGHQTQRGEYYVERTRILIESDYKLMQPGEKEQITVMFEESV
jgi:hypothetical protein